MNLALYSGLLSLTTIMTSSYGCEVIPSKPPSTHSIPSSLNCRMVHVDSVMILAIRFVRPSSYSSTVGKGDFSMAEEKVATQEMDDHKKHKGSQPMFEDDQAIRPTHCLAAYTACRRVVAVRAIVEVKVRGKADAKAETLKRDL